MTAPIPEPAYLVVGHVSRAHGTRGELVVTSLTDRPAATFAVGKRVLVGDEEGEAGPSSAGLTVESVRPHRDAMLVKFEGVGTRTEAELLRGRYLLVPSSEVAAPAEDEVFYHQLLGLRVETTSGEQVGRVREVFETEPDHLLEVKGSGRVHLVPFSRRIVRRVDLDGGRLVIDPPEGLLDL